MRRLGFLLGVCAVLGACTSQSSDDGNADPEPCDAGETCESNVDDCVPNPCLNGGTCAGAVNGHSCECAPGYTGPSCETDVDDCAPNPCLNGGTCADGVNGHSCQCALGFVGDDCALSSCVGLPDGSECDDSNACTSGETCQSETCTPQASLTCGCTPGVDCAPTGFHYANDPESGYDPIVENVALIPLDPAGEPIFVTEKKFSITFEFPSVRSFDSVALDFLSLGQSAQPESVDVAFSNDGTSFDAPLSFSETAGTLPQWGSQLHLHLDGRAGRYVALTITTFEPVAAVGSVSFSDPCRTSGPCNPTSGSCEFVNEPNGSACGEYAGTCQAGVCSDCGLWSETDCNGVCADFTTDAKNCGGCGIACATGDSCQDSKCSGCSALGKTDCGDGACRELSADEFACGACGTICSSGDECLSSVCKSYPYPAGPYGTLVGDTIANLSFDGLTDQNENGLVEDDPKSTIQLAKYQRIDGIRNTKVLVITLSALWCGPCKLEEPQLVLWHQDYETWAPGRVKFITLLSDSAVAGSPATLTSMLNWAKQFNVPYDIGLDPLAQQLNAFVDAGQSLGFPFHILVRTQGMQIEQKLMGADLATLKPAIDAILAQAPDPLTPP